MLPAFGDVREYLGLPSDSSSVALIVTVFFAGLGVGQFVYGPLADRFGRKPVFMAGLILYVVAQSTEFLSFALEGRVQEARILTGILALFANGKWPLASLILLTAVVAPLFWILSLLYVSIPLSLRRHPPGIIPALRFCRLAQDWSMLEVFLLAVIVTYVKLVAIADIGIGPGALAFGPLIIVLAAAGASFDPRVFWNRLEAAR